MGRRQRDYKAEYARRTEKARQEGYRSYGQKRYAKERSVIVEARKWKAYNDAIRPSAQTVTNARKFLSGLTHRGKNSEPMIRDRKDFLDFIDENLDWVDINEFDWSLWKEDYKALAG